MNRIDISIITPVFNTGELLYETYESIREQDLKNIEWIIVDDNSEVLTRDIIVKISQLENEIPVKVFFNEKNQGQSYSRNYGLSKARGEVVKFLDADDKLSREHLKKQFQVYSRRKEKFVVVFSQVTFFSEHSKKFGFFQKLQFYKFFILSRTLGISVQSLLLQFLCFSIFHHCSCLIPRKFLIENKIQYRNDLITDEDGDFLFQLILSGVKFVNECQTFYLYRQHNLTQRVSKNNTKDKILARQEVYESLYDRLKKEKRDTSKICSGIGFRFRLLEREAQNLDVDLAEKIRQRAYEIADDGGQKLLSMHDSYLLFSRCILSLSRLSFTLIRK